MKLSLLNILAASTPVLTLTNFQPQNQLQIPIQNQDSTMPNPHTLTQPNVLLSDVLGRDRSINTYAGLIRDVETVSTRLDTADSNSTVLAPLNSAIDALPGKPWEDQHEYNALGASAYDGDEGQERARRNIRRFVQAHVVPVSPWKEGERVRSLLDGDREIWWENKDGVMLLQPDGIEIQNVASKVGNGEVWIIKAVRKYA
ncbi:hypothetical protein F5Y03DRAFT_268078 [Xylaria venustula]|nr:hypothetical protein F5Y03DRAFT_268078 [Xylaria venustula]